MISSIPFVTDPDEVARAGQARVGVHWALHGRLAPRMEAGDEALATRLDQIVAEVMAEIDCAACGRCCQHMGPLLAEDDSLRLATALGQTIAEFQERFAWPMWPGASTADQIWLLPAPCPFHDGRLCTVYEHRPQPCRDFPHASGATPAERLAVLVENARLCPIAFNTVEQLAAESE